MRKGRDAAEWMLRRVKSEQWPRMCKQFVRLGIGVPSKSPSAKVCWEQAKLKHRPDDINDTPAFVPAFFDTGKFGHCVFTLAKDKRGRRLCISVDVKDTDRDDRREVGVVPLESLLRWGPYQGWTEDFDGVRVYDPPSKSVPAKPLPKPQPKSDRKSIQELAREVIAGKWGNGSERRLRLERAGYPYAAVQNKVNDLLD